MIRHQLAAQKHVFIGTLVLVAILVLLSLKTLFDATGFLLLIQDARIEVYLLGVTAAAIYLHRSWASFLRRSFHPAPFDAVMLAARFAFVQGVAFTVIYFLLRDIATSRAFLIWFLVVGFPVNVLLIFWMPGWLRRLFLRRNSMLAVLAGKGAPPCELLEYADRCRVFGIDFRDYFGEEQKGNFPFRQLGSFEDLIEGGGVWADGVERVLFYGPNFEDPDYARAIEQCHQYGVRVQVYLHQRQVFGEPVHHVEDGDFHFLSFVEEPLQNPLNKFFKRLFDIVISLPVVIFVLPPLSVTVWAVQQWQSPGPLFFRQTRYGMSRKAFRIMKFRTMGNSIEGEEGEARQATTGDKRIYPFGRFLRHTSLDEFPQFLNVLLGEMSVVGPRPHLTSHDEAFETQMMAYRTRHFVQPGITGYAQIRGLRGEIVSPDQIMQRVRHDLYYINHWSPQLDVYIVCKTIAAMFIPPKTAV